MRLSDVTAVWAITRRQPAQVRIWENSTDRTWSGLHEGFRRTADDAQAEDPSGISAGSIDHLHAAARRAEAAGEPAPATIRQLQQLLDRHFR